MKLKELTLYRSTGNSGSNSYSSHQILPSNYIRSSSSQSPLNPNHTTTNPSKNSVSHHSLTLPYKTSWNLVSIIHSILNFISFNPLKVTYNINNFPTTCRWRWLSVPTRLLVPNSSTAPLGRKVTGTLFGSKKGHVSFAVQDHPRSDPVLVLELATTTCSLVKEMASGLVRIALECEKRWNGRGGGGGGDGEVVKLHEEPRWSMYCNGRRSGYAVKRECGERDWHVLSTLQTVTVGAGVIPDPVAEEVMYMRAMFERVVGGRDSEAYYMMNPDRIGGPDLSIFLLRI